MSAPRHVPTSRRAFRAPFARNARLSFILLAVCAPLMLFPAGPLPWLALGLVLLAWLARWAGGGRAPGDPGAAPLVFLAAMGVMGLWVSFERTLGWPRWWSLVYGLVVYVELRHALKEEGRENAIAGGLAALGLALALVSFVGTDWTMVRLVQADWLYGRLPALVSGLPGSGAGGPAYALRSLFNPRWVGITMGVLAPVYLAFLGRGFTRPVRFGALAAFLFCTALMLLTQSLQGLLGWGVGVLAALAVLDRRTLALAPLGAAVIVVLAALAGPEALMRRALDVQDPLGVAVVLRVDLWSRALAMLRDMPFTGGGLNAFTLLQQQFYPGHLLGREPHAHNLYLQTALDFGLPGLAAFLWFAAAWASGVLGALSRAINTRRRMLLGGCMAGVAAYLAHGLIDAMMLGSKPGFVVWALFGIGSALAVQGERPAPGWRRAAAWSVLPALALAAVLLVPGLFWRNVGVVGAHRALYPFPAQRDPGDTAAVQAALQRSLAAGENRQVHLLLGRLAAVEGEFEAAVWHYEQVVALDLDDPYGTFYPPAKWLRGLDGALVEDDPAADLEKVYAHWRSRYPTWAENDLLLGLLAEAGGAPDAAVRRYFSLGVDSGAIPAGLVEFARDHR